MCLVFLAYDVHPRYRLIFAANRDEFYARPTLPLQYWADHPEILAGRDLEGMGTWLGMTTTGRFAALTNYRDPKSVKNDAPSRGHLVADFLGTNLSPADYLRKLGTRAEAFNGFNLLVGDRKNLYYGSNRGDRSRRLLPGLYGLSNHLLNTPWPKVRSGLNQLKDLITKENTQLVDRLEEILQNRDVPPDDMLPDTGVGVEWERLLAPIFISSLTYGTRCSSIITIGRDGAVFFKEIIWDRKAHIPTAEDSHEFSFQLPDGYCVANS